MTLASDKVMNLDKANPVLLFLDFDGVLHPQPCRQDELFERLPLLEEWLREHLQVEVVISSSWRHQVPWQAILERFSPDIRGRVIGHTPPFSEVGPALVPAGILIFQREAEIFAWRQVRGRLADPWIALDDFPWWFSHRCANLLTTDPATGLTAAGMVELGQRIKTINFEGARNDDAT